MRIVNFHSMLKSKSFCLEKYVQVRDMGPNMAHKLFSSPLGIVLFCSFWNMIWQVAILLSFLSAFFLHSYKRHSLYLLRLPTLHFPPEELISGTWKNTFQTFTKTYIPNMCNNINNGFIILLFFAIQMLKFTSTKIL